MWICIGNAGFDGFDFGFWFDNMILKLEVLVSSRKRTPETKAVTGEEVRRREMRLTEIKEKEQILGFLDLVVCDMSFVEL